MSEARYTGGQMALAFVAGAAVGAVVGILTAPQSGADTRAQLRRAALRGRERATSLPKAFDAARHAFSDSLVAQNESVES